MKPIPVHKMIMVLEVFRTRNHQTGMSKNQICQNTGIRNKGPILRAINLLQKDSVLKFRKVNKQKIIVDLTPLGQEIVNLRNDIDKTNQAYARFRNLLSEYGIKSAKSFHEIPRSKLLNKGWLPKEREDFFDVIDTVYQVENIYERNIYNSMIFRYRRILEGFNVQEMTQDILLGIILAQIGKHLSLGQTATRPFQLDNEEKGISSHKPFESLLVGVLESLTEIYAERFESSTNRFVSKHIRDLLLSLLFICKPDKRDLDYYQKVGESVLTNALQKFVSNNDYYNINNDQVKRKLGDILNVLKSIYFESIDATKDDSK